jgi:hypothetical protein
MRPMLPKIGRAYSLVVQGNTTERMEARTKEFVRFVIVKRLLVSRARADDSDERGKMWHVQCAFSRWCSQAC